VRLQGRSPKAEKGPQEKSTRQRGCRSSSASTRRDATTERAMEAVSKNNAEYDKAITKVDSNKGVVGSATAGHGVANANVAKASIGKLEQLISDKA
jgi:hypothetical protein